MACGLPGGWTGQPVWSLLDTAFGQGERFLRLWRAWQSHPRPPGRLHVVALCPVAPVWPPASPPGSGSDLGQALAHAARGLLAGFHRLILADGRVHLTLCIGDPLASLAQQHVQVDVLWLQPPEAGPSFPRGWPGHPEPPMNSLGDTRLHRSGDPDWPLSLVRGLARCARPGTRLVHTGPSEPWRAALRRCGFQFDPTPQVRRPSGSPDAERADEPDQRAASEAPAPTAPTALHTVHQPPVGPSCCAIGRFEPGWTRRRTSVPSRAVPPGRCGVIGAGLAGAAVAAALAQRGWEVEVLDRHPRPAGGASGLPAGLLAAQTSADDNLASRLSRAGVRLTLQQAQQRLSPGVDWSAAGTLERLLDRARRLPSQWPVAGQPWAAPLPGQSALWHAWAGWIRPAALVEAWLREPGVRFRGGCAVQSLQFQDGRWLVLDVQGRELARCDRLVLANAMGLPDLLAHLPPELAAQRRPLPALQSLHGQVSWGWHTEAAPADAGWPTTPVHGHGSLIPAVPQPCSLSQAVPPDRE
ncbi:MAG: FAD-dependent oxidoreductase, partial [Rhodoferax sp.]|nr:FAD-dependent oxidoreductase [Rhodoferax sp.]